MISLLIAIVLDWWEMVVSDWLLIIRWVVQPPFWNWHLLWYMVRGGESVAALVSFVVGYRLQSVLLHNLICHRDEVIIDTACGFGRILVHPVDIFVVSPAYGVHSPPVPVRVAR